MEDFGHTVAVAYCSLKHSSNQPWCVKLASKAVAACTPSSKTKFRSKLHHRNTTFSCVLFLVVMAADKVAAVASAAGASSFDAQPVLG